MKREGRNKKKENGIWERGKMSRERGGRKGEKEDLGIVADSHSEEVSYFFLPLHIQLTLLIKKKD